MSSTKALLRGLLELIAPRACAGCDVILSPDEAAFCGACGPLLDEGERVGNAMSGYVYGGPMADAIQRLKYGRRTELAPVLGALLAARAIELAGEIDCIVPVPLHPSRLRQRGFNQAALLAAPVARTLGVPIVASLRRARDTRSQAGLEGDARASNVRGAFVVRRSPPSRVLVIDDVRTTGATLAECSSALMKAGASRVLTLVLAHAC